MTAVSLLTIERTRKGKIYQHTPLLARCDRLLTFQIEAEGLRLVESPVHANAEFAVRLVENELQLAFSHPSSFAAAQVTGANSSCPTIARA